MIDFHCHMLAATDDGPADDSGALAIAQVLARAGFSRVHCTPHLIRGAYETPGEEIRERVRQLSDLLQRHSLTLTISAGAEYRFDEYLSAFLVDPLPLEGRFILVESSYHASLTVVATQADAILARGFIPLIAHPERTPLFSPPPAGGNGVLSTLSSLFKRPPPATPPPETRAVNLLRQKGCRFQGNLGSFAGIYGEEIRLNALTLLDQGVYSCLGSDAHRHANLERTLLSGIETVRNRIGREAAAKLLQGELLR